MVCMATPAAADVAPWREFPAAACDALAALHGRLGWDVWVVTRFVDDLQVVVHSHPPDVIPPGTRLPWADTFCRLMIAGKAPRAATVTAAVPAYANLREGPAARIAAYIGVPLVDADGEVFGTLCAWGFRARPRSAASDLPLVETMARLLSSLVAAGMRLPAPPRSAELPPGGP
jgi:GAF domain-containing protein